jgi:PTS system cellobiose-specific IIB component
VLVGPQIRYLIPQIKQNVSVPVESIKPQIYGRMDAKAVLEMVEKLLGE